MKIPILVPTVPKMESLVNYLQKIDSNKRYSNFGPLESELRTRIAEYIGCGVENIATASNATLALQGCLETSNNIDEPWRLPSWTFAATAAAAQYLKVKTFVDVDSSWRSLMSGANTNMIDVLPFGDELLIDRYKEVKCAVIDAAASVLNLKNSMQNCNQQNFIVVVSMHATKLLPAGEGAFVFSANKEWIERFRAWSNFGFDLFRNSNAVGTNAKLSEYACAVGLAAFDDIGRIVSRYREITDKALEISSSLDIDCHPAMMKKMITPYWIINTKSDQIKVTLKREAMRLGIETRDWWQGGCHKMPAYDSWNSLPLPMTERLANSTIGLPFHLGLDEKSFYLIAKLLRSCFKDPN